MACTELLCLTDVITMELASAADLSFPSRPMDDARGRVFGFTMDFQPLTETLKSFAENFEGNQS